MDVVARCMLTGEEAILELDTDATVTCFYTSAASAFGFEPNEVDLSVGGVVLEHGTDDTACAAALPGLETGAVVEVRHNNRNYIEALRLNPALEWLPAWVRGDRECVLHAVQAIGCQLQHASEDLRDDHDVVLAAVMQDPHALQHASHRLRSCRDFVLRVGGTSSSDCKKAILLKHASAELQADRDVVLSLRCLEHASPELRDDLEVVQAVLQCVPEALEHASARLRGSRTLALQVSSESYRFLSEELRNDTEVCSRMGLPFSIPCEAGGSLRCDRGCVLLNLDARSFALLPDELRNDPSFVAGACSGLLEHLPEAMRGDKAVVLTAVRYSPNDLEHASDALRDDIEVVQAVLATATSLECPSDAAAAAAAALKHASEALQDNIEIVQAAVAAGAPLDYASPRLASDADLIIAAVRGGNARCLEPLRDDRDTVLRAVAEDSSCIRWTSPALCEDREVVLRACTAKACSLWYFPSILRSTSWCNDREVALAAVRHNPKEICDVPPGLLCDMELLCAAVRGDHTALRAVQVRRALCDRHTVMELCAIDGRVLEFADISLRMDREVVAVAVQQDSSALQYATQFWDDPDMALLGVHMWWDIKSIVARPLLSDPHFMLQAVGIYPEILLDADPTILNNRTVVLAAVQKGNWALRHASESLRGCKDVVLAAMASAPSNIIHAAPCLLDDREFMTEAVLLDASCFDAAGEDLIEDDDFCRHMMAINPKVFEMSSILTSDWDSAMHAVGVDRSAAQHISSDLLGDDDFLAEMIRQYPGAIRHTSRRFLWGWWWCKWFDDVPSVLAGVCYVGAAWWWLWEAAVLVGQWWNCTAEGQGCS